MNVSSVEVPDQCVTSCTAASQDILVLRRSTAGSEPMIIDPGDAENSVVIGRMATNDPEFRMPPLGRATVDEEALEVMTQWINALQNCD